MKVQPEMLLKTKDRGNEQVPTSAIPGGSVGASPQSSILAPDSCSSRNEGGTGDVIENKGTPQPNP
jgi:hypothetical protein